MAGDKRQRDEPRLAKELREDVRVDRKRGRRLIERELGKRPRHARAVRVVVGAELAAQELLLAQDRRPMGEEEDDGEDRERRQRLEGEPAPMKANMLKKYSGFRQTE